MSNDWELTHLDHLRELYRLLRRTLQILDREDLQPGFVDLVISPLVSIHGDSL